MVAHVLRVVAKGRITLLVVILAKAGIHFSPHIPVLEDIAKGPEMKGTTNVHDDGLSPSVMKALATETQRHRDTETQRKSFSFPLWPLKWGGSPHLNGFDEPNWYYTRN